MPLSRMAPGLKVRASPPPGRGLNLLAVHGKRANHLAILGGQNIASMANGTWLRCLTVF